MLWTISWRIQINISIITNFGCDKNCWYCIWKDHPLKNCKTVDYDALDTFLCKYKHLGKVSLSGGGDPLYNYFNNLKFWKYIINRTKELGMKLDIHTRIIIPKSRFWGEHVNRAIISFDEVTDDFLDDIEYLRKLTKVRLYHTVTKEVYVEELFELKSKGYDITLKQLYGADDGGMYIYMKNKYKNDFFFLDNGDYNIYFMPDNREYKNFKSEVN